MFIATVMYRSLRRNSTALLLAAALTLTLPTLIAAQPTASNDDLTTIAQILDDPEDDRDVRIRGQILEQVSTEKYAFSDETGQIRIEIDEDVRPGRDIRIGMRVEIRGEIETAFLRQPEIDVEHLVVLTDGAE